MCGAWPTFLVSIVFVGILTTVIGDLASAFGCTIAMKDAVTAITFVAIGTSIPGLFTRWQHFTQTTFRTVHSGLAVAVVCRDRNESLQSFVII